MKLSMKLAAIVTAVVICFTGVSYAGNNTTNDTQIVGQTSNNNNQPVAIAAPSQNAIGGQASQMQYAQGGQSGPSSIAFDNHSKSSSFTTFGPAANAIRSGDCAGDANGVSLFSPFGGIGFSHADESTPCRTNQTVEMACMQANQFLQTGTIMKNNPETSVYGQQIINRAMDMLNACTQGVQANETIIRLRRNYGREYYVPAATTTAQAGQAGQYETTIRTERYRSQETQETQDGYSAYSHRSTGEYHSRGYQSESGEE